MQTVVAVIIHVVSDQPPKMRLIRRDHMIQHVPAGVSDPSLGRSILPWSLDTRPLCFQPRRRQERSHLAVEDRVVVEDHILVWSRLGKRLAHLLGHPLRGREAGSVEVEDLSTAVLDHGVAVQPFECHRRYCEEVERNDHLTVILPEGKPPFCRVTTTTNAPRVASHGSPGDNEAELQNLTMDLGCAPACMLSRHPSDELSNLLGELLPTAARAGTPPPVKAEAGTVPADDRLGLDEDQDVLPTRPITTQSAPEEAVEGVQGRPWSLAFKRREPLPEGQDFEGHIGSTA